MSDAIDAYVLGVAGGYIIELAMKEAIDQFKAENDKLRELVRDMWRDIPKSESCGWDTDANYCSGSDECKGECAYWYRMHELGIEVDG